jgi:hypothetical protein
MEAPTPPSQLRRWSPLWTSLTAVGLFLVALAAITSVALDEQVFYFARDLSAAGPALLLVAAAIWLWPRPQGQLGRLARAVVLVGLALFGLGYAVQAIGVWGWSWNGAGRYVVSDQGLAQTWEFGHTGTTLGGLALVVGVVLTMASAVQRRRRTDRRGPADPATAATSLGTSEPKWGEPGYRPPPGQPRPWLMQPRPQPSPGQKRALWAALALALVGQAAYLWSFLSIDTPYDSGGCPIGPLFANPWVAVAGVLVGVAALVLAVVVTLRSRAPVSRLVPKLGYVVVALTAANLGLFVLWPLGATCW